MSQSASPDKPPTLVLLPGMDGTGEFFAPLVDAVASRMLLQVVRYPTDAAAGYAELTAFARAKLPIDTPFVLLGESFSGPIAAALAAEAPPNLRGLVLCCSFVRNPRPSMAWLRGFTRWLPVQAVPTRLMAAVLLGRWSSTEWRTVLARALAQVSPAAMRARVHAVLSVDASADLARVQVPTLYLRATHDRVVPVAAARRVTRLKPDTQIVELPGPHFLLQVAPVEAAKAIQAFVDAAATAGATPRSPASLR
jgi:pimeloyl-ACP methyl ester carboxylesterase